MQMIPFTPKPLAARKEQVSNFNAALSAGVSAGGFPVVSIKGKVFHISRGDERTLVTKPGEDDPASSIEVVLLDANPNPSRVYYANGYEEGADSKPDCYSNNGKTPELDAQSPQASSCEVCVHAQFGSKVSESGKKGWACNNSRRMAIATPDALDEPMLIRVPGASLKPLATYGRELDGHGYQFNEVITKIGFDYTVAHPALTFKAVGLVDPETLPEVIAQAGSDMVSQIIGTMPMPTRETAEAPDSVSDLPKLEAPAKAAAKPAAKPAAKSTTKVAAKSEPAEAELDNVVAQVEAKPKTATVTVEADSTDSMVDSLDDMLDGVDFDD